MGNVLLDEYKRGDPIESYQRWLEQNPDLVGLEILAENKLFRSTSYKFNGRNIVLRAFFKRDPTPLGDELKIFETINRKIEKQKTIHLLPLKLIPSTTTQTFIVGYRQKMYQTLEEIVSAKPSTSQLKKKWFIFQMINAVYTIHKTFNYYHGHIRTSNFLETSYEFLFLTDFACYKPLYMFIDSEEGLPEFRLFYGSSIKNCTLAPQKVTESVSKKQKNPNRVFSSFHKQDWMTQSKDQTSITQSMGVSQYQSMSASASFSKSRQQNETLQSSKLKLFQFEQIDKLQAMDIFSLGCSILEIIRDGKPLLTYEKLLQFKRGELSLDSVIEQACMNNMTENERDGPIFKELLTRMLSLNPEDRPGIEYIFQVFKGTVEMNIYSLVWHCLEAFSTTSFYQPDMRIALLYQIMRFVEIEQRGRTLDYNIRLPKSLESFEALKVFKNLIKNKIIFVMPEIPADSILQKIIDATDKESQVDSEDEEQIVNDESDKRRQFFVPLKMKKTNPLRTSTSMSMVRQQKFLCPPEWDRSIKALIEAKYKGTRLTPLEIQKNNFQDLLQEFKKTQYLRQIRLKQDGSFYYPLTIIIKIIFSCIRGCKYISSKLIAIELLMTIGRESNDHTRLRRLVPYLLSLIDDTDSVVCRYAFNTLIELFYVFVDPFACEQDTNYYDMFIEMLITCIKNTRMRVTLFRQMKSIYEICQWLEVHIRRLRVLREEPSTSFRKVMQAIKSYFGSFSPVEIRELMINIHDKMWPDMFEYFVSFLNMEKLLGLEKSICIANLEDSESHKRMIDIIDSCVESGLDENGISLFYAIKYFTLRKLCSINLVNKIAPMVIHPHLWVRNQAKQYLNVCIQENPPTRIFFLFRQAFQPPFPLQPKDIDNDILLPQPLDDQEVDFSKKMIKPVRRIGLTQKLFMDYLQKIKHVRSFPVCKDTEIEEWNANCRSLINDKVEVIDFSTYIKKTILILFESNFLYYVGSSKSPYNPLLKEEEKKAVLAELNEVIKKSSKFSLDDGSISHEKKDFFLSLNTIVNSNFEKLLTRFIKEDKTNKIKISESLYLIMEALYKFEQFQIKPTLKLGEYNLKANELEKVKPRGTLLTEIFEHKDVITCLENIADKFLISGSLDGTLRVFNTRKMEMNITVDSEAVYEIGNEGEDKSKIQSIAAFENTYTIAAGTSKGHIRIFQIQRMRGKGMELSRSSRAENSTELLKYSVGGEIVKLITFKNENRNECFCFVTAEGTLGVQDIRARTRTLTCNLGKERGVPRCLAFSPMGPSILIGTLDGYVLTYDIRCNLISNIRQIQVDSNAASVTGIYQSPHYVEGRPLFAYTYPSKHYEFAYFDIYNDSQQFKAYKHFTSADRDEVVCVPTMVNKTKEENFKLCSNSLTQKIYYKQLSDFSRNFNILEHLSDPFTVKEAKIREVWMDRCKHRYNQIYSIYNKKSLPFIEHLPSGILTHLNPTPGTAVKGKKNLTLLVDRTDNRDFNQIERPLTCKPISSHINTFPEDEGSDYLTSCAVFSNMVAVGGWDSMIRIYK